MSRTLLTVFFGFHLLLGNIALGGMGIVSAAEPQVALPWEELRMTPAPTMSTVIAPVSEGEECSTAALGGCPTDRCIQATDDRSEPETALLTIRSPRGSDTVLATVIHPTILAGASSTEERRGAMQHSSPLAFHLSSVILRE